MKLLILLLASFGTLAFAQQQQKDYTTPVPILKQINRHNDDGSYSYGYEGADGSFKIETKYPTGEVQGKYGYIDDQGVKREIEYGASAKRGFEPAGTDINVPPPTLHNNNANAIPLGPDEEDDGQYREDPSIYWKDPKYNNGVKHTGGASKQRPIVPAPIPQAFSQSRADDYRPAQPAYRQPAVYQQPEPTYRQEPIYRPEPAQYRPAQPAYQPAYQPPQQQSYYQPRSDHFQSHPAIQDFDINSGSYTINYGR